MEALTSQSNFTNSFLNEDLESGCDKIARQKLMKLQLVLSRFENFAITRSVLICLMQRARRANT